MEEMAWVPLQCRTDLGFSDQLSWSRLSSGQWVLLWGAPEMGRSPSIVPMGPLGCDPCGSSAWRGSGKRKEEARA